jgi:Domain of unknown function (DUF6265)
MENAAWKRCLRAASTAVCLVALLPSAAKAQNPAGAGTQSAAAAPLTPQPTPAPTNPAKATLADFAWLEGRWRGDWGPRVAEQTWFAPKAGVMMGLFHLIEGDKTLVLELFTLVEKPGGVDLFFRHFTPELVPWEKSGATVLNLASLEAKKVDFENAVNGLPKHAILIRVDADTYTARSEINPETGDPQVIEITYHRQRPAPEKPSAGNGAHR